MNEIERASEYTGPDAEGFYTCTYSDYDIERGFIVIPGYITSRTRRVYLSKKSKIGDKFSWSPPSDN